MEIWEPEPPGTLWATPGLLRDTFTFTLYDSASNKGYVKLFKYTPERHMAEVNLQVF
jgi:hypothetical protein